MSASGRKCQISESQLCSITNNDISSERKRQNLLRYYNENKENLSKNTEH